MEYLEVVSADISQNKKYILSYYFYKFSIKRFSTSTPFQNIRTFERYWYWFGNKRQYKYRRSSFNFAVDLSLLSLI